MEKKQFHLPFTLLVLSLTAIKLLVFPPTDQNYSLPELPQRIETGRDILYHSASLPVERTTSSATLPTNYPEVKYNQVVAHQQYRQESDHILSIEIILTYIVRTDGAWQTFLQSTKLSTPENPERILDKTTDKGYYRLWQQSGETHLCSCINVYGSATVTSRQFRNEKYAAILKVSHILSWLLGRTPLEEDSCLWIHLISYQTYPSLAEAAEEIEPLWMETVDQ